MIRRLRFPTLLVALLLALPAWAAAQAPTTVIVVRHAERASNDPADRDPPLNEAGQARAQALAAALANAGVDAVITTQFKRTQLTAAPVAQALSLTPHVIAAGGQTHVADIANAIRTGHAGQTVLVVGHSNTVPAIVNALGGPQLANLCESQYSDMFIVVLNGAGKPTVVRSTYGAPSPAPGPECQGMRP